MERRDFMKKAAVGAGIGGMALVAGMAGCSSPELSDTGATDELAAKIQELSDRLWVAEAKEEIRRKLYLYARGDDRQNAEISKQAFAEDSYVDYGTSPDMGEIFKGSGWDWCEYCANTTDKGISAGGGFYAHQIYNILINVSGNQAGSETYVTAPVMIPQEDGTYQVLGTQARYCDKWECRDGDWVIVERMVTNDFGWFLQSSGLNTPYECTFDESDPSYAALAYGE